MAQAGRSHITAPSRRGMLATIAGAALGASLPVSAATSGIERALDQINAEIMLIDAKAESMSNAALDDFWARQNAILDAVEALPMSGADNSRIRAKAVFGIYAGKIDQLFDDEDCRDQRLMKQIICSLARNG